MRFYLKNVKLDQIIMYENPHLAPFNSFLKEDLRNADSEVNQRILIKSAAERKN